jgi:diguanylate cyclase (GGDEF)-like protein
VRTDPEVVQPRPRPAPGAVRRRWARWAALAAVVCGVSALVVSLMEFDVAGSRAAVVVSDLGQGLAALFAGIMCLRVGSRSDRHGWVRGWRLIGLGMLAWVAGEIMWSYYEVVRDVPGPDLSLADLAFLALVPLTLWGVGRLIGLYRGPALGVLEGLIIAGSLFYVSWATVLGPIYAASRESDVVWLQWAVNVAYPLGDVAIASAALILLGSVRAGHRLPVALLAAGTLGLAVSDSVYVGSTGTYQTGHLSDLGWIIGFVLIGLAGLAARPVSGATTVRVAEDLRTWVGLPYLPLAAAAVTSIVVAASGRAPSLVLSVLLVSLFGLVVVRQLLALRERRQLDGHLRQQQAILNQLAYSDPLTGLANRAQFEERIAPSERLPRGNTTVMFVDLDRFKDVNDAYGHKIGDAVLVATAQRLRACCRGDDMVARVGGDEFVVVAQNLSPSVVDQLAQRFLTAMRQPVSVGGIEVDVSASIGTASGDTHDVEVHELLRRADDAMYLAKESGRRGHVADRREWSVQSTMDKL